MDFPTLAIIFAAVGAGALVKGATGMGMPLIAVPFIASVMGLQHAVVVLVIPILFSNAWQVVKFGAARHDPGMKFLVPMLVACVVGIAGGVWFLTTAPERGLSIALGALLLAYFVFRIARPSFVVGSDAAMRWAIPAGLGAGILQGATGISAPIGVTFIHAQKFLRDAHVFAVSAMFLALGAAHLPSLWIAGLLKPEWVLQGFLALIPIMIFMPVGQWLSSKLSQAAFDKMILAFLGIIGLKLVLGI
ncbi:sulfite exporter TauE/SafE family protein [Pelagibacterium limicola]|uniref:sulfite exporter TauE/SafE family protein n=1 Tax=Pelagibacterium limicola TaxID=2791022 RepID=UPI0018B00FDB|nr:sulfite exporter TauE/SafE family protein [Pelagibacterium limicola]